MFTVLRRVILDGFKSIKAMDLELRALNVMIGANGAGKSNLISFFKMLNEMMGGRLQTYIAGAGRAQSVLHYGPKQTPQMEATLEFETEKGLNIYYQRLFHVAGDTLAFAEETLDFKRRDRQATQKPPLSLGAGHQETRIGEEADLGNQTAGVFRYLLDRCRVYHFHDTSLAARVRQYCYIGDDRRLMSDAGNLAALLYRLRNENDSSAYRRILGTIRLIAPFFDDFVLQPTGPNRKDIILNWREKRSAQVFGPHQLSDGTLRAVCLVTLLMQPEDELPDLIIVDEPELGLHPYALNVVAALFGKVAQHRQVLVGTQSSSFLDSFDPEDVIVVNREGPESQFVRLNPAELAAWLQEYSLGEVWEKNVIGGGPH